MRCKKCGLEQAPWKKFCGQCGEQIEREEDSFDLISIERTPPSIHEKPVERLPSKEPQHVKREMPLKKKAPSPAELVILITSLFCVLLLISGTMYAFGDSAKQLRYAKKAKQLQTTNPEKALEYAEKSMALGGSELLADEIQMELYRSQLKKFIQGQNYTEAVKTAQKIFAEKNTEENSAVVAKCYISLYEQAPSLKNIKYLEAAYAVQMCPQNEELLSKAYISYGKTIPPVQSASRSDGYKDILHLDTKLLTEADLTSYPKEEYKFIRNEIFARHGRIFTSSKYLSYFRQFSWYTPRFTDKEITLNPVEKANVDLILSLE